MKIIVKVVAVAKHLSELSNFKKVNKPPVIKNLIKYTSQNPIYICLIDYQSITSTLIFIH